MRTLTAVLLGCLTACASIPSAPDDPDPTVAPRVQAALIADDRINWDKPFDASRKPLQYVEFFQVRSGMRILDLGTAAGYTAEILAAATGPQGRVYAQIDDLVIGLQRGFFDRTLKARIGPDGSRRSNIEYWHRPIDDPGLTELDLVHWGFNLHDHLNMFGAAEVQNILAAAKAALRPGGVLAVSDHVGIEGRNNRKLHRIPIATLRQQIEQAGFRITGTSNLLANPDDDHSLNVFDDAIYRQTDRILVRAVRD